ncbi:MAG TPA: hypothetical protein P5080_02120 [Candidatus Paceibacterota bacterium]|nr:hypothetical protein [Candidatus Pacearchaeota archaeon]HRZ50617.1 hypothetical protein [Candidatus Paceibacterota bacterium]HSA36486.1 hypothetical protein [Candidatus Paceibacterota bacterium]
MDKKILIPASIAGIAAIVAGAAFLFPKSASDQQSFDCASICQKASQTCPSLVNETTCNNNCSKLSDESKKHLSDSNSCQEISSKPELIADLLIPETAAPEPAKNADSDDCQMACMNYAIKCLTLVPNASDQLLDEGRESCGKECSKWNSEKIDCMINAADCESMTNICGL